MRRALGVLGLSQYRVCLSLGLVFFLAAATNACRQGIPFCNIFRNGKY